MGLLTILRKNRRREKEMRILILGLDNAGKTTLLNKLRGERIDTIAPTLGFNISTMEYEGTSLTFWDVGGQKSIRAYWRNYFEQTEGIIWVIDATDTSRLQETRQELIQILGQERLAGASLLILANKQDLPGALDANSIKKVLQLEENMKFHWAILPCSAVSGWNVVEGIRWLVDDIRSRIFVLE